MDCPEASSGAKRTLSPLLLPTTKRVKLDVPQDQLAVLNIELNTQSESAVWPLRLQQGFENPLKMTALLSEILVRLLLSVAKTSVKDHVVGSMYRDQAEEFVKNFNPDERRDWEDGIKMCMESKDWKDLITQRMYAVIARCVFDHGHSETSPRGSNSQPSTRDHVRF
jgi:hypothetical protein